LDTVLYSQVYTVLSYVSRRHILYSFEMDYSSGILTVNVDGYLSEDVAARFVKEMSERIAAEDRRTPSLKLLIDASKTPVHQVAAVAEIHKLGGSSIEARPTAVVVGSNLTKMQAERGSAEFDVVRIFMSSTDAIAWLTGETGAKG
jgi:hypothetical protein